MEDGSLVKHTFQCHLRKWFLLFEQKKIFDEQWMKNLLEPSNIMSSLAKELVNMHQAGEMSSAKEKLTEVEMNYVQMRTILEQYEYG